MRHDYKNGYKIVMRGGNRYPLESACEPEAIVEYGIGLISKPLPGCGPLAVIDTLNNAVAFIGSLVLRQRYLLYYCRYTPSKELYMYNCSGKCMFEAPPGTILATTVELIEEIKQ